MRYHDYYQTLGVARDASGDDIKRAYRRLARKFHPDVSKDPNAEERFKSVAEAYEVLKDPEKRSAFDRLGSGWKSGQDFTPPPGWGGGFRFSRGRAGHVDDGEIFSEFFESLFGARTRRRGAADASRPRADESADVSIGLEEAYRGGERAVRLSDGRTLRVKIPAGVIRGQRIRLGGQGRGGADVFLTVHVDAHPRYSVVERDVHVDLPVAPWEAALGARVEVTTPGGPVNLDIPPGSQSGRRFRLKGRGLGGLDGKAPGDFFVALKIVNPPAEGAAARALFQRMAEELRFDPRAEPEG